MSSHPATAPPPQTDRPRRTGEGGWLSVTSIILGSLALILAILPAVIYGERPWDDEEEKKAAQKKAITLETKRFKVTFGGKEDPPPQTPAAQPASPIRTWHIAMIITAVLGMTFAPFAWMRERHRPIAGSGAAMCCLALTWQYIIAGIVIGVALAFLLFFLYHLSS